MGSLTGLIVLLTHEDRFLVGVSLVYPFAAHHVADVVAELLSNPGVVDAEHGAR